LLNNAPTYGVDFIVIAAHQLFLTDRFITSRLLDQVKDE